MKSGAKFESRFDVRQTVVSETESDVRLALSRNGGMKSASSQKQCSWPNLGQIPSQNKGSPDCGKLLPHVHDVINSGGSIGVEEGGAPFD